MRASLRYEWRRISTVRATWILTGSAVIAAAAIAEIIALTARELSTVVPEGDAAAGQLIDPSAGALFPLDSFVTGSAGSFITLILLGVVAAQAFGQDFRHGTIRLTLTMFPRRPQVFASKAIIMAAVVTVAYVAAMLAAALVAFVNRSVISTTVDGEFLGTAARSCLYMLGFSLIVFAITVLTRILALGVIIPLLLALVVEPTLVMLKGFVTWIPDVLPFSSGMAFMVGHDVARAGLVFLAWVVVLLAAALLTLERRDA